MTRKPSVSTRCVANFYAGPEERIVEFSAPSGAGGLISLQVGSDGKLSVHVYRLDDDVTVTVENRA